jgi:hypothetical protein
MASPKPKKINQIVKRPPPKPPKERPKGPTRRKGAKRIYSDAEKAQALACVDANGGNVIGTAKQLDIPHGTLVEWVNGNVHPAVLQMHKENRTQLADMLRGFIARVLSLTDDRDIKLSSVKDRFVALGIAAEKQQLLDGDATSISGQAEMTDDELLERLQRLAAQRIERSARTQIEQRPADPGTAPDRTATTGP